MSEAKKACLRCYGHAVNLDEALVGGHVIAPTGTVHKLSDEDASKTECGVDIGGDWTEEYSVSDPTANARSERVPTPQGARRGRVRHRPPSARWTPEELAAATDE